MNISGTDRTDLSFDYLPALPEFFRKRLPHALALSNVKSGKTVHSGPFPVHDLLSLCDALVALATGVACMGWEVLSRDCVPVEACVSGRLE